VQNLKPLKSITLCHFCLTKEEKKVFLVEILHVERKKEEKKSLDLNKGDLLNLILQHEWRIYSGN
jgi:hypothetical protein